MSYSLPDTPILAALPELRAALRAHPGVVLEAPPGAGKSTVVPLALLDEPWLAPGKRILMLQPRRIADPCGRAQVGAPRGQRARAARRLSHSTRVARVGRDADRGGDRRHPRATAAGRSRARRRRLRDLRRVPRAQPAVRSRAGARARCAASFARRPATARDVGDAGRRRRRARARQRCGASALRGSRVRRRDALRRAGAGGDQPLAGAHRAARGPRGLARARVPTRATCSSSCRAPRKSGAACEAISAGAGDASLLVLPLYGDLDAAAQDAALRPAPDGRRKVVVATNLAETSLTIEGVRVVVDAGLERRQRFDPNSGMSRLETVAISRASADQRRGRAGRTAPGVCYRLWSESAHARAGGTVGAGNSRGGPCAAGARTRVLGRARSCGSRVARCASRRDVRAGARTAQAARGDRRDGQVTPLGRRMAGLGTHPRLAHMIERGAALGLGELACDMAALLSERDPLRAQGSNRDPDLRHRVDVLHGAAPPAGLSVDRRALPQIQRSARVVRASSCHASHGACVRSCRATRRSGVLLAFAYPDRIGLAAMARAGATC